MSNIDPIQDFEYDPRSGQYQYNTRFASWPPIAQQQQHSPLLDHNNDLISKRSTSPLPVSFESNTYHHTVTYPSTTSPSPIPLSIPIMDHQQQQQQHHHHHHHQHAQQQQQQQQWQIPTQPPVSYPLETSFTQQAFGTYDTTFQSSPTEYGAQHHPSMDHAAFEANVNATIANTMGAGMAMNDVYTTMAMTNTISAGLHSTLGYPVPLSWPQDIPNLYTYDMASMMAQQPHAPMGSPVAGSETYISDSHSLHSWEYLEHPEHANGAIFNPQQTLHPRTFSDSSSDNEQHSRTSLDGFVEVAHSISSPGNSSAGEMAAYSDQDYHHELERELPRLSPSIITRPVMIPRRNADVHSDGSPPQRSPTSPTSKGGRPRKSTATSKAGSTSKGITKKTGSVSSKDGEKRVGKRKGPLREDQRKQASEIRKLGACIRCRFLKKTCDTGTPCGGCQPSHARLWLVPCTRIDIKDLGYFVKDWNADFERHVSLGFSIGNIKGFGEKETTLFITHGYGQFLPIPARDVFVRDDRVFGVDWVEADRDGVMNAHEVLTAHMAVGRQGISNAMINDYLDRHIDNNFEGFVDEYFMDSPFFPDLLKVVYRFWLREKTPIIRTALKFVLAYNFTQAVCLVKPIGEDQEAIEGAMPEDSYYHGNIAAPCMINFQVKCLMAEHWRALQAEVLQELSHLYTRVYSKDKLKHWPTIFMIGLVLLVVWEEMQFDCRYRVPEGEIVEKFCKEMIDTPVGVIVGLFSTISVKIPSFLEWDTPKHQESLNSNPSVCQAMEEVRDHVKKQESYLKGRSNAAFDRNDFDCLSNMFVSKLVIRAH